MKKKLSLFLAAMLCCAAVFFGLGCGSKYPKLDPENPVSHYYSGPTAGELGALVKDFNLTVGIDRGVKVEEESASLNDLIKMLHNAADGKIGSDPMPSMFMSYRETAEALNDKGLVAALDDYITEKEEAEYVKAFMDEGRFGDGKLKIFPIAKSFELLYLNKTEWNLFSADTGAQESDFATIEGIVRLSEKYYDYSGGNAFFGRDAMANYMLVGSKQLGEEIYHADASGNFGFDLNEARMRKLWDNYYVPMIRGYFVTSEEHRSDDMKRKRLIAYVGASSSAPYFPKEIVVGDSEKKPFEGEVFTAPIFAEGENYAVQQGAGIAVTKSDPKTEYACTVFLKWLTQRANGLKLADETGYLPVKADLASASAMKDFTYYMVGTEVEKQTLVMAAKTVEDNKLYTSSINEDARLILDKTLDMLATSDLEAIAAGTLTEQECLSDAHFRTWLADLKEKLDATIA